MRRCACSGSRRVPFISFGLGLGAQPYLLAGMFFIICHHPAGARPALEEPPLRTRPETMPFLDLIASAPLGVLACPSSRHQSTRLLRASVGGGSTGNAPDLFAGPNRPVHRGNAGRSDTGASGHPAALAGSPGQAVDKWSWGGAGIGSRLPSRSQFSHPCSDRSDHAQPDRRRVEPPVYALGLGLFRTIPGSIPGTCRPGRGLGLMPPLSRALTPHSAPDGSGGLFMAVLGVKMRGTMPSTIGSILAGHRTGECWPCVTAPSRSLASRVTCTPAKYQRRPRPLCLRPTPTPSIPPRPASYRRPRLPPGASRM